ncbi:MAG TPA: toll/interleukin-1 receptor domain-containing protein [Pyrinomonadaceae bacterium]|nr:toll/interleukin-1 receptor domain-containing protein [Pyrinomonadaceae bacterium]
MKTQTRKNGSDTKYTKDFFVSYTQSDKIWAEWIAWELQEAGYTVTLQAWNFAPSQSFMQRMRQALVESRHLIAVLSKRYLESEFAGAELDAALAADPRGLRAKLIPIRVGKCELDEILRTRIYIDLVGKETHQARNDLQLGIAAAVATVTPTDAIAFKTPPPFPGKAVKPVSKRSRKPSVPNRVKVLYLGMDIGRGLNLRGQYQDIQKVLTPISKSGRADITGLLKVTADSLPDILNKHLPTIVHFSGNQNGGRVLIRADDGGVTTVPANALAGLLKSLDGTVKLAIIDTCESLQCASQIISSVDLAMGVKGRPYEHNATAFYNAFYKALAAGRSVESARNQAAAALRFKRVPNSEIPLLCARKGVDPKSVIFFPKSVDR